MATSKSFLLALLSTTTVVISADVAGIPPPPPPLPPSLAFSAGFSSDMVLQATNTTGVKIYGFVYYPSATVKVTVSGGASYTVDATIGKDPETGNSTFVAQLKPSQPSNSVEYTIVVMCASGCEEAPDPSLNSINITRVVFGDVFYCSGQSNMALSLKYSFSALTLQQDVLSGKYSNIRTFQYGGMSVSGDFHADTPRYVTTTGAISWNNLTYSAALPQQKDHWNRTIAGPFQSFSATCTYFGVGLTDELGENAPPIGLIQAAVGGTQIEAWLDNHTLTTCNNQSTNVTNPSPPSKLFYGMVAPFINMSLAGWAWYQGENNCHGYMGNSMNKTGYGCDQVELVSLWRQQWSSTSATDPVAPFGIVSLAAGGSEGAGDHMAGMRWSQTGNYGSLPNAVMPNTFMAHAYDIGDPWATDEGGINNCSDAGPGHPPDPECVKWDPSSWAPVLKSLAPLVKNSSATPTFMGGIHPRFKHEVGRRLAVAHVQKLSGPTIASCTVDRSNSQIIVELDSVKMGGEAVLVQPFNNNVSSWSQPDASTMMVCTGAMGSTIANKTSCGCLSWAYFRYPSPTDPNNTGHDRNAWYCEVGPADAWKPSTEILEISAKRHVLDYEHRIRENIPEQLGWVPSPNPFLGIWAPPVLKVGAASTRGNPTFVADMSSVNGSSSVMAVRYGWPISGDTCCPSELVRKGLEVCQPAACPVLSATTNLPLNPFFATLENDKCKCPEPQQC